MKNTLREDFDERLPNVQRAWIRRGVLILITPLMIVMGAVAGIFDLIGEMYIDCW